MSFAIHSFTILDIFMCCTLIIQRASVFLAFLHDYGVLCAVRLFVRARSCLPTYGDRVCVHARVYVYSIITESEKVCFR